MRPIVSFITAAAFLLHMWLGCCAHHAHADDEANCHQHTRQLAAPADHSHAGHDHEAGESQGQPTESPCPADGCDESHCVFLSVGKTDLAKTTTAALLPALASESIAAFFDVPPTKLIDSGGLIGPPIRLHLLNQVLLI